MIGVIDYSAGNLTSVAHLLERIGADFFISDSVKELSKAKKILFPGVGHAKSAMNALCSKNLDDFLKKTDQKMLAICIGMQLLFDFSEEGETECLGIFSGNVKKFETKKVKIVPHMGWNEVEWKEENELVKNIVSGEDFYFVHSFFCEPTDSTKILCTTQYEEQKFCSGITHQNISAVQFHPEKSGKKGEEMMRNFVFS